MHTFPMRVGLAAGAAAFIVAALIFGALQATTPEGFSGTKIVLTLAWAAAAGLLAGIGAGLFFGSAFGRGRFGPRN
jgi:hypothetical protein